ncbi:hypothetical protein ACLOJK_024292 [Asimina triloba]
MAQISRLLRILPCLRVGWRELVCWLDCGLPRFSGCFGDDFLAGSLVLGALLDGAVISGFGHDVGQVGDLELDGARWMVAVAQIWIEICYARWVML